MFSKEFGGYDKKVLKFNQTIGALNNLMVWWMALNRSEKNARHAVEKLVVNAEQSICDDSRRLNIFKIDVQGKSNLGNNYHDSNG